MREICTSGSMCGVWKRRHGRASEAPPNERGGNRYVRPTATAPHLDSTEDSSLPPVGRAAGIVKGFRTPAGHGRDEMRGRRRPKSLGGGNRGGCAPAIELTLEDLRRRAGIGGWCAGYRQSPFIGLVAAL